MGSFLKGIFGSGDDAADATKEAAKTQAGYQQEALNYLKETEKLPQQLREGALTGLGDIYGQRGAEAQNKFFSGLESNPIYSAIMSGQAAGEDAILRNASATGGLRSGNASYNLADYNTKLKNEALLSSYNNQVQGLQGLSGIQSMAPQIANATSGIGQTLAQGTVGAAQSQQQFQQNQTNTLMGLGNLGALVAFSDVRLKDNIRNIGKIGKYNKYSWDWNETAKGFGLLGSSEGVMAHEVEDDDPSLVSIIDGYKVVDYSRIN